MDVTVSVVEPEVAVAELRSLLAWLNSEEELRGRVRLLEAASAPGTLGGLPHAVTVALSHGGEVTILASAVISWIRHRTSEVTCTITRPDGTSAELTARRVRGADLTEVGELVERTVASLGEGNIEGGREEIPE
ncbi:MAG: effector-associated constant component EACC1 [Pseudonocardiaceae bacterium]